MKDNAIYILGTLYQFHVGSKSDYPQLEDCDGYTDTSVKKIVISDLKDEKNNVFMKEDCESYKKQVARHEVLHAFLYESGLDSNSFSYSAWATNEEIVDWFAIQYPKIKKAYQELGIE